MTHDLIPKTATPSDEFSRVLQTASYFDRDFSIDWLIRLTDKRAVVLLEILETAAAQEILTKKEVGWFSFSSPEIQLSWQKQVPPGQQTLLHREIGRLLLRELPDNAEKASRIFSHLNVLEDDLEDDLERCQWLSKAGDLYLKSLEVDEAARCYTRLLRGLGRIEGEVADALFIATALKYSGMAEIKFDIRKMPRILAAALERAENACDEKARALIYMNMARNEWYRSNFSEATKWFKTGWQISEGIADQDKAQVTYSTFFHYWQGLFTDAVTLYEKAVSGDAGFPKENFPLMAASTVGYCYILTGQTAQGLGMIDTVRTICAEQDKPFLQAFADIVLAISLLTMQREDQALILIQSCHRNAARWPDSPLFLFSTLLLAYAHYRKKNMKKAAGFAKKFITHRERLDASMWPYPYVLELGWAVETGEIPGITGLSIDSEISRAFESGNVFLSGIALRYQAFTLQKNNAPAADIIQALEQSETSIKKSGHIIELARTRLFLANILFAENLSDRGEALIDLVSTELSSINLAFLPDDLKPVHQNRLDDRKPDAVLKDLQKITDLSPDIGELLYRLVSSSGQWLGAERGAVFLKSQTDGSTLPRLVAARNLTREISLTPTFAPSMEIIQKTMAENKGVVRSRTCAVEKNHAEPVHSLICIPIRYNTKIVGALYHDNRLLPDLFDSEDMEFLTLYASVMGLALSNLTMAKELDSIAEGRIDDRTQDADPGPRFGIIGQSKAVNHIFSYIDRAAPADVAVLIHGETGVGKELVAKAIHLTSPRQKGPFIAVNCNALPDELIGSELFGHEKGAFTNAIHRRIGRFEQAHNGTLFIDEVGEMSVDTQIRLLRVLQTREFERIGGHKTIRSDFRLIVATNRSLEKEISKGQFRSDLFYRLNTFPIHVPPLRERKEDIPLLARHFLKTHTLKTGRQFKSFPQTEMKKLLQYNWPGNIRELEHIIERGALLSMGQLFKVPVITPPISNDATGPTRIGKSLREIEIRHILDTLDYTGGKIRGQNGAAKLLDLNPSTLYSKMKKLDIQNPKNLSGHYRTTP